MCVRPKCFSLFSCSSRTEKSEKISKLEISEAIEKQSNLVDFGFTFCLSHPIVASGDIVMEKPSNSEQSLHLLNPFHVKQELQSAKSASRFSHVDMPCGMSLGYVSDVGSTSEGNLLRPIFGFIWALVGSCDEQQA